MMPVPVEPKIQQEATIYGIPGIDISVETRLVGSERLAELINFDLYAEEGVATVRPDIVTQKTLDDDVTMLIEHNNKVYAGTVAGTLYADGSSVDSGYGAQITAASYVDGDKSVLYLADKNQMRKIVRSRSASAWGLAAPGAPPVLLATSGGLTGGTYQFVYTYVERIGDDLVQESNPSAAASILLNSSEVATVTMASDDQSDITHYRVYRTQANGSSFLFEAEVVAVSGAATYTATIPDDDLGTQVSSDNDPPIKSNIFAIFQDRGWLSDGINLYYSEKSNLNAWPALNVLPAGSPSDPVVTIVAAPQGLAVFTKRRRYRVIESLENVTAIGDQLPFFGGSSNTFFLINSSYQRGVIGLRAAASVEGGILFVSHDGVFLTNVVDPDLFIGEHIRGLFANRGVENIQPIDLMSPYPTVVEHRNRFYFSYRDADGDAKTLIYSKRSQSWWVYDLGFQAAFSSERDNALYIGNASDVALLDNYSAIKSGSITASLRTHSLHFGAPFENKVLVYLYVDSNLIAGETLSGSLYIDGALDSTFTVSGATKVRFPPGKFGRVFAVDLSYTGTRQLKIRGIRFVWMPLRMA